MKISGLLAVLLVTLCFHTSSTSAYFVSAASARGEIGITSDLTPPDLALTVDGLEIREWIDNGDFESGLNGWTTSGEVSLLESDQFIESEPLMPFSGSKMIRLGSQLSSSSSHSLKKVFPRSRNLRFSYLLATGDHLPFDNPAFVVRINGQTVYTVSALQANPAISIDSKIRFGHWQEIQIYLGDYNSESNELELILENNNDGLRPSWIYLDSFTTDVAIAKDDSVFEILGNDLNSGIHGLGYQIDQNPWLMGSSFTIPQAGQHIVSIRAVDNSGNTSLMTKSIEIDSYAPEVIADLLVDWRYGDSARLSWIPTSSGDKLLKSSINIYRDCTDPDNFVPGHDHITQDLATYGGQNQITSTKIRGLDPQINYCFAINISDVAGNISQLSNIAH